MVKGLSAFALITLAGPVHAADPAKYIRAELVAETTQPKPGTTILVGFRMTPKPGWHGYWSNPGDSGIAPSVSWNLPSGVTAGPLLHPAPTLLLSDGISSFVHTGAHVLLTHLRIGRSVAAGTHIALKAQLDWAACTQTQCVPLHQTFTLDLLAGGGVPSADAESLRRAAARVPRSGFHGTFSVAGKELQLLVPAALRLDSRRVLFFPDDNGTFDTAKARSSEHNDAIAIAGPVQRVPRSLSGVLSDGVTAYHVAFAPGAVSAPTPTPTPQPRVTGNAAAGGDVSEATPGADQAAAPAEPVRRGAQEPKPQNDAWWWAAAGAAASVVLLAAASLRRKS
jgi:DsbC/DsbD-like thiol-disulfide interchange protein